MRDSNTQPAGADNGVAGFSMKKTLIIAGLGCLLLVTVGIAVAIVLLARGGGSDESPEKVAAELPDAPATAVPIATALPAATDRPVAPGELTVAAELRAATAVPIATAPPAATTAPVAPTVERAAMPWPEVVRMHEEGQGDDPTGLYTDALMSLRAGDITGEDVLETVDASNSFATYCAMTYAWNDSNWKQYETDGYKTVARRLAKRRADGWASRDSGDCDNDLDWSSLTN